MKNNSARKKEGCSIIWKTLLKTQMLILLYGMAFYTALAFDGFWKWRTPIVILYSSMFPVRSLKKHADIKMTINLICNYVLLYTMSKTNKSFTRPNVFYLNILHNFKDSFSFMFTLIICLLFTFINILNSQFKIYSRMGGDIFWVGVEWPSWHILQQFCSNIIPILYSSAWNLTSCPVSLVFLVQWLKSILGCN